MKCQTEGCNEESTVKCTLPSFEENEDDIFKNLCATHAEQEGYCICCGGFWAGCESYDFSPVKGICENCIDEFRDQEYDEDDLCFENESDE